MEARPYLSNALQRNELGLGRIMVKQPRVRARQGKSRIWPELMYRLFTQERVTSSSHELNMNFGLQYMYVL